MTGHSDHLVSIIKVFHAKHAGVPQTIHSHMPACPVCGDFHDWVEWTMDKMSMEPSGRGEFFYTTKCGKNGSPVGSKITVEPLT